jgi:hypothetical protein
MSKVIATKRYLFTTVIGNILGERRLIMDADVEDIVQNKSESQAQTLALRNLARQVDQNPNVPQTALPTIFTSAINEEDEEI